MKATLYGRADGPAAAVVGTWDPFVPAHRQLLEQLSEYTEPRSLISLVIILHPHPVSFIHGSREWPTYDDVSARLAFFRSCGIDASLIIRFTKADLDLGAKEFLHLVRLHAKLSELWLGPRQSLGVGSAGDNTTIAALAKRSHIHLKRLPESRGRTRSHLARQLLVRGRLQRAITITGHAPIWRRPTTGKLRLPWPSGRYWAVPLKDPLAPPDGKAILTRLVSENAGPSTLLWPNQSIKWLAFMSGPGDK
jgi:FAD synthase